MQKKNWVYKNKSINQDMLKKLSESMSPVIATLLLNRNITDYSAYFKKPLSKIHSPLLLQGVNEACDRIISAINSSEKIVIYGDYDVDGITSTVLLYKFLLSQKANVSYYIPTRADEGYGINILALNKIIKSGANLLITVDCGITAVGEVEFAKLQGLDVIITDHHNCQGKIPKALSVINPKLPDSLYPFSGLAGVGVAFKLILGIAIKLNLNTTEIFSKYSELAAIGSIADLVPLTDENRIIVDKGLKKLSENTILPGIKALLEICSHDKQEISSDTVAFSIAPRLNASGRLSSASLSVELLLTDDIKKAKEIAQELNTENTKRRETEQIIFEEALEMINQDTEFDKKKVIVLHKENWHQGVIGIVASRICERFYRPTIMISTSDENAKGSGRSIPSFNLFEALKNSSEHLVSFGGHSIAAGLNIKSADIKTFKEHINKYSENILKASDLIPTLNIDCEISPSSITHTNIKFLSNLEPFGMGNEIPVFSMCDVRVNSLSEIGNDKKHIRLTVSKDGFEFNCIGFGMGEYASLLNVGDYIDIAFGMTLNNYQNKELIQLRLKDIRKVNFL